MPVRLYIFYIVFMKFSEKGTNYQIIYKTIPMSLQLAETGARNQSVVPSVSVSDATDRIISYFIRVILNWAEIQPASVLD